MMPPWLSVASASLSTVVPLPLQRALNEVNPPEKAELQFTTARALSEAGQEPERARRLATEALQHYRTIGNKPRSEAVSQWLGQHFGTSSRHP